MRPLLLIGCGAFGRVHRAALARLGLADRVPGPDLAEGGVAPLAILDAARRSAQEMRVVEVAP